MARIRRDYMAYTSPTWVNNNSPFLSASNLQALTDQVEANQRLSGAVDPTSATPGLLGQTYVNTNTSNVFVCAKATSPYVWHSLTNPKWYQLCEYTMTETDPTSLAVTINLADYMDYYKEIYVKAHGKKSSGAGSSYTLNVYCGNSTSGPGFVSVYLYQTTAQSNYYQWKTATAAESTYTTLTPGYLTSISNESTTQYVKWATPRADWHYNQLYVYYNSSMTLGNFGLEVYGLR